MRLKEGSSDYRYFPDPDLGPIEITKEQKDKYHEENMLAAELVLIDVDKMPKTHEEIKSWVTEKSRKKDYLILIQG